MDAKTEGEVIHPYLYDGIPVGELSEGEARVAVTELLSQTKTLREQIKSAPFNPFTHLSSEQVSALIARLNPQWVKEHGQGAADSMLENGCSLGEATIHEWLRSTADDYIEAKLVTSAIDSSRKMLENISAGSMAAVAFIVEDYSKLKAESQRKFRIAVRDAISAKFHGETATRVFDKVSVAVGVTDVKLWMR